MQYEEIISGTGALSQSFFSSEEYSSAREAVLDVVPTPLLTRKELNQVSYHIRTYLYLNDEEIVQEWFKKQSFDNFSKIDNIGMYSMQNIKRYIKRGVEKYKKMRFTKVFNLSVKGLEDIEIGCDHLVGPAEFPNHFVANYFQAEKGCFYCSYKDKRGKVYRIEIPEDSVNSRLLYHGRSTRVEIDDWHAEEDHIVSLFFFYLLGIQVD